MWTCPKCQRIFQIKHKELVKELFDKIAKKINQQVGKCKIISLPCCIHLFGKNDFLVNSYGYSIDIKTAAGIDHELLTWIFESYHLKDAQIKKGYIVSK